MTDGTKPYDRDFPHPIPQ